MTSWTGKERDAFFNELEPDGSYGLCWKKIDPIDPASLRCTLAPDHAACAHHSTLDGQPDTSVRDVRDLLDGDEEGRRTFPAALAHLISYLSEDCWCAGWLIDCEHQLWDAATRSGDFEWGLGVVPRRYLDTLLGLAEASRQWVEWTDDGARPVPLNEWIVRHIEWSRKQDELRRIYESK